VLDAFSSDAIPVHLLTREALAVYQRLLAPGGVLLAHISNRHLRLEPVVAALAGDAGVVGFINEYRPGAVQEGVELNYRSEWVVLVRRGEDAGGLASDLNWRRLGPSRPGRPWTDDYSDVFRLIRW
jgi:hypothetical protein